MFYLKTITYIIITVISLFKISYAKVKHVHFATTEWPPFYSSKLNRGGPIVEITREAFKSKGYKVSVSFIPWKRALKMTLDGKFDGIIGGYTSKKREKVFITSKEICSIQNVVWTLKSNKNIFTKIRDLKGFKVGVGSGWTYGKQFDSATYFDKFDVSHVQQNMRKLIAKRVDLFIASKKAVEFYIDKDIKFKDLMKPFKLNIKNKKIHNLFPKRLIRSKTLVDDFNQGLKIIINNKLYYKILQKYDLS